MKRFGTSYGGFYYDKKTLGEKLSGEDSIVYCVGAGEDISHDVEIAKFLNLKKLYIFDPTPRAIVHVNYIKDVFFGKESPNFAERRFGGGDPNYMKLILDNKISAETIIFEDFGIFTSSGDDFKFYSQSNQNYVSKSVVPGFYPNKDEEDFIEVRMKTLKETMNMFGHTHIDLLKIDIEGCECEVINQMITEFNIFPTLLSVDFDSIHKHWQKVNDTIKTLKDNGYVITKIDGQDYSFFRESVDLNRDA